MKLTKVLHIYTIDNEDGSYYCFASRQGIDGNFTTLRYINKEYLVTEHLTLEQFIEFNRKFPEKTIEETKMLSLLK